MAILEDSLHKSRDLVPVSQICRVNRRGTPKATNLISRSRIVVIPLYQYYVRSSFGQSYRHRLADASRGTGDERGLAMEVELVGEWHFERYIQSERQIMLYIILHRMSTRFMRLRKLIAAAVVLAWGSNGVKGLASDHLYTETSTDLDTKTLRYCFGSEDTVLFGQKYFVQRLCLPEVPRECCSLGWDRKSSFRH